MNVRIANTIVAIAVTQALQSKEFGIKAIISNALFSILISDRHNVTNPANSELIVIGTAPIYQLLRGHPRAKAFKCRLNSPSILLIKPFLSSKTHS